MSKGGEKLDKKNSDKNGLWNLLKGTNGEKDKKKSFYWIILLVLIGMLIMIFSSFFEITDQSIPYQSPVQTPAQDTTVFMNNQSSPNTMQDYEELYENQLTELLTEMLGVGEVNVKVNLDSTEELVIEKNRVITEQITKEKDNQGGIRDLKDLKRDEQVVIYNSDKDEQPLVLKTLKPKVRGVVVVAEGSENVQVKAMITEAVQRLLDVAPHKIAILPRKSS